MMQEYRDEVEAVANLIPEGEIKTVSIRIDGYTDLRDSKNVLRPGPPKNEYVTVKVKITGKKKVAVEVKIAGKEKNKKSE